MVDRDGFATIPSCEQAAHHRGWRGKQQQPQSALEEIAAGTGRRTGPHACKVCHFPPGTSKWNKIEHRLFCFITKNWRGRPLTTYEVIVNLIASTTTKTGLIVRAAIDSNEYETGVTVSDEELDTPSDLRAKFHGEWNYTIKPARIKLLNLFFRGALSSGFAHSDAVPRAGRPVIFHRSLARGVAT